MAHGLEQGFLGRQGRLGDHALSLIFYGIEQRSFLRGGFDRGQVFSRDFINYWTGSRLLLEGKVNAAFVQADYARELLRLWGGGVRLHSFSYPPSLFPFIAWTGALDYGWAITLWSLMGAAILLAAASRISRKPSVALLIMLSPAVLVCLDDGQNGLLTAGLLVGGLRLADRRPLLGGFLLGLATFKPQLGLLIPLALIAAGRWRVIAGAAASAAALAGMSVLLADLADRRLGELAAWRWAVVALWSAPVLMVLLPAFLPANQAIKLPAGPLLVAVGLGLIVLAMWQRRTLEPLDASPGALPSG